MSAGPLLAGLPPWRADGRLLSFHTVLPCAACVLTCSTMTPAMLDWGPPIGPRLALSPPLRPQIQSRSDT